MTILTKTLPPILAMMLASCSVILEEQNLPGAEITEGQEDFNIVYLPMTMAEAQAAHSAPFPRYVERAGQGKRANVVLESSVLGVDRFPSTRPIPYQIGVGDTLQLIRFITGTGLTPDQATENVIGREASVSADGRVLFIETGFVDVAGRTLADARELVSAALIRNGVDPRFQLEVSEFNSKKVNLTVTEGAQTGDNVTVRISSGLQGTGSYPVTERPLKLKELLVSAGLKLSNDGVQVVSVNRGGRHYHLPVSHIFAAQSPDYYLTGDDDVQVEFFPYQDAKAYVVGAIDAPAVITIKPESRPTLADALFTEGGTFATKSARTSEIYLLRGKDPMVAYHLDAQNASRLKIAAEMELRPQDVIFVSRKPIYSLNELATISLPVAATTR